MKAEHHVSDATKHTILLVRNTFFVVLGISLLGVGFWDTAFPSQGLSSAVIVIGSVGLSNTIALIVSGLIMTALGVFLLTRLRQKVSV